MKFKKDDIIRGVNPKTDVFKKLRGKICRASDLEYTIYWYNVPRKHQPLNLQDSGMIDLTFELDKKEMRKRFLEQIL